MNVTAELLIEDQNLYKEDKLNSMELVKKKNLQRCQPFVIIKKI